MSDFDFDALRDPVAPDPDARQRSAVDARAHQLRAASSPYAHSGECDVDRRRARRRGRCRRGDSRSGTDGDGRRSEHDVAPHDDAHDRRAVDRRPFHPADLDRRWTRRVARDVPQRRDHDAALPARDEDRATRLRWRCRCELSGDDWSVALLRKGGEHQVHHHPAPVRRHDTDQGLPRTERRSGSVLPRVPVGSARHRPARLSRVPVRAVARAGLRRPAFG